MPTNSDITDADVLVIGAGMAGVATAHFLSQAGARVAMVGAGAGETTLSAGSFAVSAQPHAPSRATLHTDAGNWTDYLLSRSSEQHTSVFHAVHRLLADSGEPDFVTPVSSLLDAMGGLFLPLDGSRNRLWLTSAGTLMPAATVLSSMEGTEADTLRNGRTLLAGFEGLLDFQAGAARAVALSILQPDDAGILAARTLALPGLEQSWELESRFVAQHLEDDGAAREKVGSALARAVGETGATRVLMPAVLGVLGHRDVRRELAAVAGCPVSEVLSAGASVPGIRLSAALEALVKTDGIPVLGGRVENAVTTGRRVESVAVDSADGPREIRARAFVLATGRFIGGGLAMDNRLRETVFDLPVFAGDGPAGERDPLELTDSDPLKQQALLGAGLRVDERMQPIDEHGNIRFENLFAAGSVLQGCDFISAKAGLGAVVLTAWAAAQSLRG